MCTRTSRPATVFDLELIEERSGIVILRVSGTNATKLFKNEPGGHRFQRVPPTERSGRVHTSTITVAVLAVPDEKTSPIADRDLRWTFCRAGGCGGQHVNKTESAVQLMHIPTGTMVRCESESSQTQNKVTAMTLLRARLADTAQAAGNKKTNDLRRAMLGGGQRGDKTITIAMQRDQVTHHVTGKCTTASRYMKGYIDDLC